MSNISILIKEELLEKLPSIPRVVHEVWNIVSNKKEADLLRISEVISKDLTLSAKVLKIVNSPLYGFPHKISSIKHAVVLLGLDAIKGILIGTVVFGNVNSDIKEIWTHACDCATVARVISEVFGIKDSETLIAAGLLHDMGKAVLKSFFPNLYLKVTEIKKKENISDQDAERIAIGVTHDVINGWITEKWNFPESLSEPISFHHNIGASEKYSFFTAAISLADFLSHAYRLTSTESILPDLSEEVCDILKLNHDVLEKILLGMDRTLYNIEWNGI